MEIKNGDTVVVDGKTSKIQTSWGAGKHKIFKLTDGREITDLHLAIESGAAKRIVTDYVIPKKNLDA